MGAQAGVPTRAQVWAETGLPAALDHVALRAPAVVGLLLLRAGLANPIVDR
jgi:hypothetical protein